jgi:leucyl aminopeptidase
MTQADYPPVEIINTIPEPSGYAAVAVFIFEDEREVDVPHDAIRRICEQVVQSGEFKGEAGTSLLFHAPGEDEARRLLLLGLGRKDEFDHLALSRAAAMDVRQARSARIRRLSFVLPGKESLREARAVAEGALYGLYENDFYQKSEEEKTGLEALEIISRETGEEINAWMERGRVIAESVNWTRRLSDEPGATLPPEALARRAAEMAVEFGLMAESLDAKRIQELGMGALWGVGKGSDNEPALIVIRKPGG